MPSLHITTSKNHGITFIPLLQHAKNTGLTVKCTECNKPRLVYSQKKISVSLPRKFKLATDKLWFTCGATVKELIGTEQQFADLFIRVSLTCQKPVEAIYYSVGSYPNVAVIVVQLEGWITQKICMLYTYNVNQLFQNESSQKHQKIVRHNFK